MSDESYERRRTDPLILEMHGMLSSIMQELKDHIKVDDKAHEKLDDVDRRLMPVEEFHGSARTAGKVVAIAGTPVLLGIGAAIWAWFKNIIIHTKVAP